MSFKYQKPNPNFTGHTKTERDMAMRKMGIHNTCFLVRTVAHESLNSINNEIYVNIFALTTIIMIQTQTSRSASLPIQRLPNPQINCSHCNVLHPTLIIKPLCRVQIPRYNIPTYPATRTIKKRPSVDISSRPDKLKPDAQRALYMKT